MNEPLEPSQNTKPRSRKFLALHLLLAGIVSWLMILQAPQDQTETIDTGPSTQLLIMSRHAIGYNALASQFNLPDQEQLAEALFIQILNVAESETDQLHVVMIMPELMGTESTLTKVASLKFKDLQLQEDLQSLGHILRGDQLLNEDSRDGLIRRHGWFAEVALIQRLPEASPERKRVIAPAIKAEVAMLLVMLIVICGVTGGAILLFLAMQAFFRKQLKPAYVAASKGDGQTAYLEVFILFLGLMPVISFIGSKLGAIPALLMQCMLVLTPAWALQRGVPKAKLFANLGLTRGKGLLREFGSGFVGYIAGLPILACGLALTLLVSQFASSPPAHPIANELAGAGALKLGIIFFMACILAPVLEELLFRGALHHHLRRFASPILAALINGVIFAVIHPQGLFAVPALTAIGFNLAIIREWRGTVIPSMVAHAINNGSVMCLLVFMLG